MRIKLTSVFVDDQDKALSFYTDILGFVKKYDISMGECRWLTLVSPEDKNGTELLLEPNENPAATEFQRSIFQQGIAAATFFVDDANKEYERLNSLGVVFKTPATDVGPAIIAVLEDTCGNLIQINQVKGYWYDDHPGE